MVAFASTNCARMRQDVQKSRSSRNPWDGLRNLALAFGPAQMLGVPSLDSSRTEVDSLATGNIQRSRGVADLSRGPGLNQAWLQG